MRSHRVCCVYKARGVPHEERRDFLLFFQKGTKNQVKFGKTLGSQNSRIPERIFPGYQNIFGTGLFENKKEFYGPNSPHHQ